MENILQEYLNKIQIYFPQVGSNDCGLFALAYVNSICQYKEPSLIQYNQAMLRANYNSFVTNNELQFNIIETHFNCLRQYTRYSITLP